MKSNNRNWDDLLNKMDQAVEGELPSVSQIDRESKNPFFILISTILSLRTRDEVTLKTSRNLLEKAKTPQEILNMNVQEIESLIYPAAFFRNKAANIQKICSILINQYAGKVPADKDSLLALPGVGLKTCNLVLSLGFGIPAICVDIHVHRIANRMGWISSKTPDESEIKLQQILPEKHWIRINEILVAYGQRVCTPQSPWCSRCVVFHCCYRKNVTRSR